LEKTVVIKSGREKSILGRHPWIFSGAIHDVEGEPEMGETVRVVDHRRNFLCWGAYSPFSSIRIRVWSWDERECINTEFFYRKLEQAVQLRKDVLTPDEMSACRLVYAESDGLPGMIIDRYGDYLVLQCLTAGAEHWREVVVELITQLSGVRNVYERSDVDVRSLEQLPERKGLICGDQPPPLIKIRENDLNFLVDIQNGQKTGFFLDQRRNRLLFGTMVENRRVLNCFSYTGAFTVYALRGGARQVVSIDSSAEALEIARQNAAINGFNNIEAVDWFEGDVFFELRRMRDRGQKFDVIVLDPPKFAPTAAQAEKAARGYKDINLLAFKLLNPGGVLFTFSCSGGISEDLFQKIVAGAALDAGVQARILYRLHQSPDHPVALHFPESAYLKGLVCRNDPW